MYDVEFDVVISIGEDCACAMYLKELFLRDASYPFDWLCNATFEKRIELIVDGFDGFLLKENMKWFPKPTTGLRDKENDNYEDTNTGFYFYHDFKENVSLDETYDEVRKKYDRRIKRFYNSILANERILFVWWSRDKKIEDFKLVEAQEKLSCRFGKNVYLMCFENECGSVKIKEKQISEHIMKITADLLKGEKTTQGDKETTLKALRKVRKKNVGYIRVKSKFRKILANILAGLIPVKSLRKHIRRKVGNDN